MSSVFDEKAEPPNDAALTQALGRSKAHWDAIMRHVEDIEGVSVEWKFYGKKHGWQVKAVRKKKALIYLIPHQGSFLGGMALDEQALAVVRGSALPPALVEEIVAAKPSSEGHPARVEVGTKAQAELLRRLLAIKLTRTDR
jgi:hypothetical protein